MKKVLATSIIALFIAWLCVGCEKRESKMENVEQRNPVESEMETPQQEPTDVSQREIDTFLEETMKELTSYEGKTNELKTRSENLGDEYRSEFDQKLAALIQSRTNANAKVEELKKAKWKNLQDAKGEMAMAMKEVQEAYERLDSCCK